MRKRKCNINFDLDDSLVDYTGWFKEYMADLGYNLEPTNGFFFDVIPITTDHPAPGENELMEMIKHSLRYPEKINVIEGARSVINYIYENTFEPMVVITKRDKKDAFYAYELADEVFQKIPYTLIFVNDSSEKYKYMFGRKTFYDDRRLTGVQMAEHGFTAILPELPYNMPTKSMMESENVYNESFMPDLGYRAAFHDKPKMVYVNDITSLMKGKFENLIFS